MQWNWLIFPMLMAAFLATAYFWSPLQNLGKRAAQVPASRSPVAQSALRDSMVIIADNLTIPWEIVWLPDGSMLITQRPGSIVHLMPNGQRAVTVFPAPVTPVSESGLLGMALDPNFSQNQFMYFYYTLRPAQGKPPINRVSRFQFANNALTNETIIVDNIPAGNFHDGGRLKFGPDSLLYVATGDSGNENLAQNPQSLAGKILRVEQDGVKIYSLGHRNVQGLAWDSTGNLWATEHGRSGIQSGLDELNLIKPRQNYGWPTIQGDETKPGLITPVINSGASETWAPSGATFLNGSVFFAGLKGETLYEAKLNGEKVVEFNRHFAKEFGRLRNVAVGPDGFLYILTNNTDGRLPAGRQAAPGDDKLIRIDPESLK